MSAHETYPIRWPDAVQDVRQQLGHVLRDHLLCRAFAEWAVDTLEFVRQVEHGPTHNPYDDWIAAMPDDEFAACIGPDWSRMTQGQRERYGSPRKTSEPTKAELVRRAAGLLRQAGQAA